MAREVLSPVAARLLRRGRREIESGDAAAGERTLGSALALAPAEPEIVRWLGIAAQNQNQPHRAAKLFAQALTLLHGDADLHTGLGVALFGIGDQVQGLYHLRRGCELAPNSATVWYNLGEALKLRADVDGAIRAFERTLDLDPAHQEASVGLARVYASIGLTADAESALRAVLARDPACSDAWAALADLKVAHFSTSDVDSLRRLLASSTLAPHAAIPLRFVLARALEDQRDYQRAFDELESAHAAQRPYVHWDAAQQRVLVEATQRVFAGDVARALDDNAGSEVIFIVSLPRSGSTLLEQMLASHPDVEGANEIQDLPSIINAAMVGRHNSYPACVAGIRPAEWQQLGQEYLVRTARWRRHKPRFTDKCLVNWMSVGVGLSMLPASRFVVVRRDPVETCLACYRQWFDHGAEFANDLDDLVSFYLGFWQLTRFWLHRFPDRVMDLQYEALVAQPEPTIRRLLDFCGLPFDPACLEFYKTPRTVLSAPSAAQVRQPLHNTARAAHYGHLLDGLRARLRAGGIEVADVD